MTGFPQLWKVTLDDGLSRIVLAETDVRACARTMLLNPGLSVQTVEPWPEDKRSEVA